MLSPDVVARLDVPLVVGPANNQLTDDTVDEWRGLDALLLGAVGTPGVPPGVIERGLLPLKRLLWICVGLTPLFLYVISNVWFFGSLGPVSSSAKRSTQADAPVPACSLRAIRSMVSASMTRAECP